MAKELSLNILEIAKKVQKLEEAGLPDTYPADQVMMSDGTTSVEDAVDEVKSGLNTLSISKLSINKQSIPENTSVNLNLAFGVTYLLVLTAGYSGFAIVALLSTNYQSNSVKIDKIIDNNGSGNLAVASVDAVHVTVTVGGLGYDAKLGIMPVA